MKDLCVIDSFDEDMGRWLEGVGVHVAGGAGQRLPPHRPLGSLSPP